MGSSLFNCCSESSIPHAFDSKSIEWNSVPDSGTYDRVSSVVHSTRRFSDFRRVAFVDTLIPAFCCDSLKLILFESGKFCRSSLAGESAIFSFSFSIFRSKLGRSRGGGGEGEVCGGRVSMEARMECEWDTEAGFVSSVSKAVLAVAKSSTRNVLQPSFFNSAG